MRKTFTLLMLAFASLTSFAQEKVTLVYDFAAAAAASENPTNLNGSTANGAVFYIWEAADKTDNKRQDFKGYTWAEGSVLPQVCHVWRRSDRINGNMGDGGLKCPSNKEMVIDGVVAGSTVTIEYTAADESNKMIWAAAVSADEAEEKHNTVAKIGEVDAVSGVTEIASGETITITSTPGYFGFKVLKNMVITKITIVTEESTTNVKGVAADKQEDGTIYNLSGQRVQNAKNGMYIIKGKKVMVK